MFNIIQYRKNNNESLFKNISDTFNIYGLQNYIPIYTSIFNLTEKNYNKINLNMNEVLHEVIDTDTARVFNTQTNEMITAPIHIKFAAILDPFRYIMGKYVSHKDIIYNLPTHISNNNVLPRVESPMNSSYTDSFFYYLTTKLLEKYDFVHGVKFYGNFVGIQNEFKFKINDDLEYLTSCKFFIKNSNKLFKVDDYSNVLSDTSSVKSSKKKEKLIIDTDILSDELDNVIEFDNYNFHDTNSATQTYIDKVCDMDVELFTNDIPDDNNPICCEKHDSSEEDSCSSEEDSCSSEEDSCSSEEDSGDSEEDSCSSSDESKEEGGGKCDGDDDDNDSSVWEDERESDCDSEDDVFVTLDKFPITFICMEKCQGTLDALIENDYFETDEMWYAMFMQVIMILIVYQKAFSFTHNDLHTNNIMFVETDQKFLTYIYKNNIYNIPTYGKIFKIIDFGRSIYKVNNINICSDCYDVSGDAYGQYNCPPFINSKKPLVFPNPSFDLCRLGTSIFDYLIHTPTKHVNIIRLVEEWCNDDTGKNILYKSNGDERYPDFKLYKMIARTVHNHTPENQLLRHCFTAFIVNIHDPQYKCIDIDTIPSFFIE